MESYKTKLADIRVFFFDVDGVLTDGKVYITPDNQIMRSMNTKDGLALKRAVSQGYRVVIISGGRDENILPRLGYLGITDIYLHTDDKLPVLLDYLKRNNIPPEQAAYMGDDIPDMAAMKAVGLAACPADAAFQVKDLAHYVSPRKGGEGCVRDLIEQVLTVNGHWFDL